MLDARRLLNAVVGGIVRPAAQGASGQAQGQSPLSTILSGLLGSVAQGGPGEKYVQKARDFVERHPGLAEAALTTVAGTLMRSRKIGGIAVGAARLGGLALVAALAYKAYQTYQAGRSQPGAAQGQAMATLADTADFDPASLAEDDALLFARAMIAAVSADGRIDQRERERILKTLSEAGIDPDASHWLRDELESPATVDELADAVETPEKGAQVYAAARLAIDPDTVQEREFLRGLAQALDLDPQLVRQIDDATGSVRV